MVGHIFVYGPIIPLAASGLGSNVSIWHGPPARKIEITALALGVFSAFSRAKSEGLKRRFRASPAAVTAPNFMKSRREYKYWIFIFKPSFIV